MKRLAATGLAVAAAAGTGCAHRTLHPSHGESYHALFGAQVADHEIRPPAPMSGDEAQAAMQSYRATLAGASDSAGAGGSGSGRSGAGMQMPNLSSGGGSGGAGQPGGSVNFKVR